MNVLKYGSSILPVIFKNSGTEINMDNDSDTISKLKFIGRINKGEKVNTKFLFVQPANELLTKVSRTYYGVDRLKTFNFVQKTISESFRIIDRCRKSEEAFDKKMCENIIIDLNVARKGIMNLRETYEEDVKYCCDLDTMLEGVDSKLGSLGNIIV